MQSPGVNSLGGDHPPECQLNSRGSMFTQSPDASCCDEADGGNSPIGGDTRDREILRADAIILGQEQRDMPVCSDLSRSDCEDSGVQRCDTREHEFYIRSKSSLSEQAIGDFSSRLRAESLFRKGSENERRSFLSASPALEHEYVNKSDFLDKENVNIWIHKEVESICDKPNEVCFVSLAQID